MSAEVARQRGSGGSAWASCSPPPRAGGHLVSLTVPPGSALVWRSEQGEVEGPEPTTTLPRPQPEDRHAAGPVSHPSSPDSRPFLLASQKDVPSSHLSAHSFVSWAPQATQADSLPLGYSFPSYCPPTPSLAASMCQPNPRPCTSREQAHCYLMGQGTRWGVVPGGLRTRPRSVAHLCVQRTPPSPSVKWDLG